MGSQLGRVLGGPKMSLLWVEGTPPKTCPHPNPGTWDLGPHLEGTSDERRPKSNDQGPSKGREAETGGRRPDADTREGGSRHWSEASVSRGAPGTAAEEGGRGTERTVP